MFPEIRVTPIIKIKSLITAFQPTYSRNLYFDGEIHDFWEFVYVINGRAGCSSNDKVYELTKGDIIFHKPRHFHKLWAYSGEDTKFFIASFSCSGDTEESLDVLGENPHIKINKEARGFLQTFIDHFYPEQTKHDGKDFLTDWNLTPAFIQVGANYLENFLLYLVKNSNSYHEHYLLNDDTQLYTTAVSVMTDNIDKNLTVPQIATLCNTSPATLKSVFSKYSSGGIHKYFTNLKIIKAIDLLSENISVGDISNALSFKNPNYFAVVFKRETGYSPQIYKKKVILKSKKVTFNAKTY